MGGRDAEQELSRFLSQLQKQVFVPLALGLKDDGVVSLSYLLREVVD